MRETFEVTSVRKKIERDVNELGKYESFSKCAVLAEMRELHYCK